MQRRTTPRADRGRGTYFDEPLRRLPVLHVPVKVNSLQAGALRNQTLVQASRMGRNGNGYDEWGGWADRRVAISVQRLRLERGGFLRAVYDTTNASTRAHLHALSKLDGRFVLAARDGVHVPHVAHHTPGRHQPVRSRRHRWQTHAAWDMQRCQHTAAQGRQGPHTTLCEMAVPEQVLGEGHFPGVPERVDKYFVVLHAVRRGK